MSQHRGRKCPRGKCPEGICPWGCPQGIFFVGIMSARDFVRGDYVPGDFVCADYVPREKIPATPVTQAYSVFNYTALCFVELFRCVIHPALIDRDRRTDFTDSLQFP